MAEVIELLGLVVFGIAFDLAMFVFGWWLAGKVGARGNH